MHVTLILYCVPWLKPSLHDLWSYGAVRLHSVTSTLFSCGLKETMKVADIPGPTLLPASFGPSTWKHSEFCSSNLTCCDTFQEKKHTNLKKKIAHLTQQTVRNGRKQWFIHYHWMLTCTACSDKSPPHDLFQSFCSPVIMYKLYCCCCSISQLFLTVTLLTHHSFTHLVIVEEKQT